MKGHHKSVFSRLAGIAHRDTYTLVSRTTTNSHASCTRNKHKNKQTTKWLEYEVVQGKGNSSLARVRAHLIKKFLHPFERRLGCHRGLGPPARLPNRLPPPLNRFGPLVLFIIVEKQRLVVVGIAVAVEAEAAGAEYRG